ncbi:MAG: hypothetical protein ABIJ37_10125 [Pseudomonadota bacterium]
MTKSKKDYFLAYSEDGSLSMRPYCGSCGFQLNENYFCDNCQRQCICTHVKCEDKGSYDLMNTLTKKNERFKNFTIEILLKDKK